jgi:hypothetical protein
LECDPGYVSDKPPFITCVEGKYQPASQSDFVCKPAVALILTTEGELELFSHDGRCNDILTNLPPFITVGQTIDLLDNQLSIVGFNVQTESWSTMSLENPRGGLLANLWTYETITITKIPPHSPIPRHLNFVYGQHLVLKGGEEGKQTYPSVGQLKSRDFFDDAVTKDLFSVGFSSEACRIRLNKDIYFVIGGFPYLNTQKSRTTKSR